MAVYCVDCEAGVPVGHRDVVGASGVVVREEVQGPLGVMLTHPAMVIEKCDGSECCENGRPVWQKGHYCCAAHAEIRTGVRAARAAERHPLDAEADAVAEERADLARQRAEARLADERAKLARERAEFEAERSEAARAADAERERLSEEGKRTAEERAAHDAAGGMDMPTAQDPAALSRRERKAAEREAAERQAREREARIREHEGQPPTAPRG